MCIRDSPGWLLALQAELPAYAYVGIGRDGYVFDEFTPIFYLKEKYDLVDVYKRPVYHNSRLWP